MIIQDADKQMMVHPALKRSIDLFGQRSPVLSARAFSALKTILQGVYHSNWPEVAWEFSNLTEGGFPLEFTFSSRDDSIRYAAEVAGPELAEVKRLCRASQMLSILGAKLPSEAMIATLCQIQTSGKLRYGAWIGGRHCYDSDCYKLYVEIPKNNTHAANDLIKQFLGVTPLLTQKMPQLVIIGYEPESSRVEFYFRVKGLELWEVGMLLRRVDLASRQADLLGLIEILYGRQIKDSLPGGAWIGFSFSITQGGGSPVFSIFTYAGSLCGSDKNIRCKVLDLAHIEEWDFESYARLSEPLANRLAWMTYHTMMTFCVAAEGTPIFSIGLRPPEYQILDDDVDGNNNGG